MRVVAFDTETALIRPAQLAPPLVCLTWQSCDERGGDVDGPHILHQSDVEIVVQPWLADPKIRLVLHNASYDMAVLGAAYPALLPAIFAAYDADRVTDTMIRQQLLDIAIGRYPKGARAKGAFTLETLAKRCAGIELQKDGWRLSYANFIDTPLDAWPAKALEVQAAARPRLAELEARAAASKDEAKALADEIKGLREMIESDPRQCLRYPLEDARATLAVYLAQEKHRTFLEDQYRQARAAFALHLSSAWGLRTDRDGVEILRRETQVELEECEAELIEAGLVRTDGTRDTKAAKARMISVCLGAGLEIPRTDAHDPRKTATPCEKRDCAEHVSLDAEACEETEDEILIRYAELSTLKKVLSNDIKALEGGTQYPIHTRYGLAETGRTTSSKPNIQNWARGRKCKACDGQGEGCGVCGGTGTRAGAREAFIPRPGRVFAQADFPQLELYTLAQVCVSRFRRSTLADILNAGLDPHLQVAARIVGIPQYEEAKLALKDKTHPKHKAVKEARGAAKPLNFGLPGGIGVDSYVDYAWKGYGVRVARDRARELIAVWRSTLPEMGQHFAFANAACDNDSNRAIVETLWTKRTRANATYCAACNSPFQALGADCAKRAAWLISKACYVEPSSPLFNARMVAFIHDEFILEIDDTPSAHDAAVELARLMVEGANVYLPDVPIPLAKMEPLLMRRWSKKAEPVIVDGRLVPWAEAA